MPKAPGAEQVLGLYIMIMMIVNTYQKVEKIFFLQKKTKILPELNLEWRICQGASRDHVPLIINPYSSKCCGHRPCRRGDIVQWQTANDCIPYPLFYKKNLRSIFRCVKPYLYQHINISIISNSYLYQHFIDFRINMRENKQKRM